MGVTLSHRIIHWRAFAGMSQADLARAVGVSTASTSAWETGKNVPRLAMLERIAAACGITLAILFSDPLVPMTRSSERRA